MRVFKRLHKLVPLIPALLRLTASAVETLEDRRLTDVERAKLWEEFMALVRRASRVVTE